jgi:Zn-dependent peptidase ImmA (M78 family)
MTRIAVNPDLLQWAAERARLEEPVFTRRFPKWREWLSGDIQPTLRQLEDFARFTHVPFGYFFLPEPPAIGLPVPDFRTVRDTVLEEPSAELLDTIYLCQQRQDWFREYAILHGLPRVEWVGSLSADLPIERAASLLREALAISIDARRQLSTWTDALRQLIGLAEQAGVLMMASSIVGSNPHRKLDVSEVRGFALVDDQAPLVFLNAGDSKAAQMFTLAHELAHIGLGESGVSNSQAGVVPDLAAERWCNQVAAEILMPLADLRLLVDRDESITQTIQRLAREFKVSTLVALRRLFDAGQIDENTLWRTYQEELERLKQYERSSGGGDFYRTLGARTGKRFAHALVANTLEGQTLFQDAFRLLGVRNTETFYHAARELGVTA